MSSRDQMIKDALKLKEVQDFVNKNNISADILDMNLLSLVSFQQKLEKCANCHGLNECKQDSVGYKPILDYSLPNIYVDFDKCPYLQALENEAINESNLITLACSLDDISIENIYSNEKRKSIIARLLKISESYCDNNKPKGMYLYGYYGCGKTYIIASICKSLAKRGKKVVFAYYPDLVRQIKSYIGTPKFEKMINLLKTADVVALDDFGGEVSTSFIRDEVLGPILQERMTNNALTFITSNLDKNSLKAHLEETKDKVDEIKALRIMERINSLMDFVMLEDKNYRLTK